MPDHLGSDQRKVKDDEKVDKPIQGNCFMYIFPLCQCLRFVHHHV